MTTDYFQFPNSTSLKQGAYLPFSNELILFFRNKRAYVFFNVDLKTVEELKNAPSAGKYFIANIKNKFQSREITKV